MRISILGTGRMGSWLVRALAMHHNVMHQVTGFDRGASPEEVAASQPELLINCVSLDATVEAFREVEPLLPETCILCDIASVKTGLLEYYAATGRDFVSTHPMFGPTWTRDDALQGQNAVIIAESCGKGAAFWEDFYRIQGVRVWRESFAQHDRTITHSLAIPFASTMAFAACMRRLDAPGTTFSRHLEIARGLLAEDDSLLTEIMLNPHAARSLELIGSQLSLLAHIIRDGDRGAMTDFLGGLRERLGLSAGTQPVKLVEEVRP